MSGHTDSMGAAARFEIEPSPPHAGTPTLAAIYSEYFDFVWRSARRMGVAESAVDDVVQEVFLVAHRRLSSFEGRSSVKTWVFGILVRVVSDHRRTLRRKGGLAPLPEALADERARGPAEAALQSERVALLHRLLAGLDEDQRAVFVLAELEQMTAPEISEALEVNLNTVYSRLRLARKKFEAGLARHRARESAGRGA